MLTWCSLFFDTVLNISIGSNRKYKKRNVKICCTGVQTHVESIYSRIEQSQRVRDILLYNYDDTYNCVSRVICTVHTANGKELFADAQPLILYDWSPIMIASMPFRPSFTSNVPTKCTFLHVSKNNYWFQNKYDNINDK